MNSIVNEEIINKVKFIVYTSLSQTDKKITYLIEDYKREFVNNLIPYFERCFGKERVEEIFEKLIISLVDINEKDENVIDKICSQIEKEEQIRKIYTKGLFYRKSLGITCSEKTKIFIPINHEYTIESQEIFTIIHEITHCFVKYASEIYPSLANFFTEAIADVIADNYIKKEDQILPEIIKIYIKNRFFYANTANSKTTKYKSIWLIYKPLELLVGKKVLNQATTPINTNKPISEEIFNWNKIEEELTKKYGEDNCDLLMTKMNNIAEYSEFFDGIDDTKTSEQKTQTKLKLYKEKYINMSNELILSKENRSSYNDLLPETKEKIEVENIDLDANLKKQEKRLQAFKNAIETIEHDDISNELITLGKTVQQCIYFEISKAVINDKTALLDVIRRMIEFQLDGINIIFNIEDDLKKIINQVISPKLKIETGTHPYQIPYVEQLLLIPEIELEDKVLIDFSMSNDFIYDLYIKEKQLKIRYQLVLNQETPRKRISYLEFNMKEYYNISNQLTPLLSGFENNLTQKSTPDNANFLKQLKKL